MAGRIAAVVGRDGPETVPSEETEKEGERMMPERTPRSAPRLREFDVFTFDCYGTLIDWETGMLRALEPLLRRLRSRPTDDEILALHGRFESMQQEQTPTKPYRGVLEVVYRRLAEQWGVVPTREGSRRYAQSVGEWPAFADTVEALRELKRHGKLVILSNVDNLSFQHSNDRLGVVFDAIYTAEDIGSYKPSRRNFEYMLARIEEQGVQRSRVLHVAESLYHDHVPALEFGLATCWIHRRAQKGGFGATREPAERPEPTFRFESMADFVAALRSDRCDSDGDEQSS